MDVQLWSQNCPRQNRYHVTLRCSSYLEVPEMRENPHSDGHNAEYGGERATATPRAHFLRYSLPQEGWYCGGAMTIGMDCYKFCAECQKRTPHVIVKGDGCVAKICLRCQWTANHPYAEATASDSGSGLFQMQPQDSSDY